MVHIFKKQQPKRQKKENPTGEVFATAHRRPAKLHGLNKKTAWTFAGDYISDFLLESACPRYLKHHQNTRTSIKKRGTTPRDGRRKGRKGGERGRRSTVTHSPAFGGFTYYKAISYTVRFPQSKTAPFSTGLFSTAFFWSF